MPNKPQSEETTTLHNVADKDDTSLAKLTKSYEPVKKAGVMAKLRDYFLTGLIVVGPLFITIYAVWTFVTWIDALVKPYLPEFPAIPDAYNPLTYIPITLPEIPGIGLIFAVFALMVVGALMANLFGQTILGYGERMVGRMPIIRSVYQALKQIFETVLSQRGTSFQKIGLIEYPRRGIYSIVFISKETEGEIANTHAGVYNNKQEELVSVFLPTTPNPTSGYLLFVPKQDVKILDMSVEEGAKLVISAGLVEPGVVKKNDMLTQDFSGSKNIPNKSVQDTPTSEKVVHEKSSQAHSTHDKQQEMSQKTAQVSSTEPSSSHTEPPSEHPILDHNYSEKV